MRRDIANEVVVAIVAVAVIAFALSFGILLTLSSNTNDSASNVTSQANGTDAGALASVWQMLTVVSLQTSASVTPGQTLTPSGTPTEVLTIFTLLAPTQTPTRSASATRPATATDVATATKEAESTPTPTSEAVESPSVDATLTPTLAAQSAVTQTRTAPTTSAVTPTKFNTSTHTPTAIATSTATATVVTVKTTIPPTRTTTNTATSTATNTATATNTSTSTSTATATFTAVATNTPSPMPPTLLSTPTSIGTQGASTDCQPRMDWPRYLLSTGDTLESVAQQIQVTETELKNANCLTGDDVLIVGDVLLVPKLPIVPTPANGFPLPTLRALGCADANFAIISNLYPGQRLSGQFVILGTAQVDRVNAPQYSLEIRLDSELRFQEFSRSTKAVNNGELARSDTGRYGKGIYWLRLVLRDSSDVAVPNGVCVIPAAFD